MYNGSALRNNLKVLVKKKCKLLLSTSSEVLSGFLMRALCLEILLNLQVGILDEEFLILRRVGANQILPPLRKK